MEIWNYHDTKMKELKTKYNRTSKQTQNRLQEIFDSFNITFDKLYNIADKDSKQRINTYIESWKEQGLLKGYFGVLAKSIYRRRAVKNNEILELLIYSAYIEEQNKLNDYEKQIIKDDINHYYEEGQKEVIKTTKNNKKVSIIPDAIFLTLLDMPNYNGLTYEQYIQTILQYNAQQMYKQAVINIQQQRTLKIDSDEFRRIIEQQNRQRLNIKDDKISGAIDLQLIGMNNCAKIEGIKSISSTSKYRFISVEDKVTTPMCHSLDGQIFNINDYNEFDRYYGETENTLSIKKIKCFGAVIGLNIPPINHHFHFCRSSITYLIEYTREDLENGVQLEYEERRAIVNYISSNSYTLNSLLRNDKKLNSYDETIKNDLDRALSKMPKFKGKVYRSLDIYNQEQLDKLLKPFFNNDKIGGWSSYTSSSVGIYDETMNCQMQILSKNGRNLTKFNNEGNGEILFTRNTQFKMISIKKIDSKLLIKLKEV